MPREAVTDQERKQAKEDRKRWAPTRGSGQIPTLRVPHDPHSNPDGCNGPSRFYCRQSGLNLAYCIPSKLGFLGKAAGSRELTSSTLAWRLRRQTLTAAAQASSQASGSSPALLSTCFRQISFTTVFSMPVFLEQTEEVLLGISLRSKSFCGKRVRKSR